MYTKILSALLFASAVGAQSIAIGYPPTGTTVSLGQTTNVELDFADSLTPVQHVSVVISYRDCADEACDVPPTSTMGTILFSGNFTPAFHEGNKPPYQNFTVEIPNGTTAGSGLLNVAHFFILGASSQPILEFKNVSVNTQANSPTRFIRGRQVV